MKAGLRRKLGRPYDPQLSARRREEILAAAARIFAGRGYPGAETQAIADSLGIAKGTIYRYFPSKRDLFLSAVDRGMRLLLRSIETSARDARDPLERLSVAVGAYLGFFRENPEFVELLIQERAGFKDRKTPSYFVNRETSIAPWRDLFRGLMAGGRVRAVPVDRILDVIGDLVYGTMFTNYFTGRRRSLQNQARDILDIVFHGILTERERKARLKDH